MAIDRRDSCELGVKPQEMPQVQSRGKAKLALTMVLVAAVALAVAGVMMNQNSRSAEDAMSSSAHRERRHTLHRRAPCPATGNWPETAEGELAGRSCAETHTGYLWRQCNDDGEWEAVVGVCNPRTDCPVNCEYEYSDPTACFAVAIGQPQGLRFTFPIFTTLAQCGGTCVATEQYESCTLEECTEVWVSHTKTTAVDASSVAGFPGRGMDALVDGDLETWWMSDGFTNQYVTIQMDGPRTVKMIRLYTKAGRAHLGSISIAATGEALAEQTVVATLDIPENQLESEPVDVVFPEDVTSEFFRLFIENAWGEGHIGFTEVMFFAFNNQECYVPEPLEPSTNSCAFELVAVSSSEPAGDFGGENALDDNLATLWKAEFPGDAYITLNSEECEQEHQYVNFFVKPDRLSSVKITVDGVEIGTFSNDDEENPFIVDLGEDVRGEVWRFDITPADLNGAHAGLNEITFGDGESTSESESEAEAESSAECGAPSFEWPTGSYELAGFSSETVIPAQNIDMQAAFAVDGDTDTQWRALTNANEHLSVGFPNAVYLSQVRITRPSQRVKNVVVTVTVGGQEVVAWAGELPEVNVSYLDLNVGGVTLIKIDFVDVQTGNSHIGVRELAFNGFVISEHAQAC